jgi:hypothetical protein
MPIEYVHTFALHIITQSASSMVIAENLLLALVSGDVETFYNYLTIISCSMVDGTLGTTASRIFSLWMEETASS